MRLLSRVWHQTPWPRSTAVAPRLDTTALIEEENSPDYHPDRFMPVHLGQIVNSRYQVANKLGHGANSTVWLARDLHRWRWSVERYVALKVNATGTRSGLLSPENEVDVMKHIGAANPKHGGWHFVRKLADSFTQDSHVCLVSEALREPLWLYRKRYVGQVIPPDILKILLQMILKALDYLHSECHVIHTDLKPGNIMVRVEDPDIFQQSAKDEFENPLPQKHLDDRVIYLARNNYGPLERPTGSIQLVDFDLARRSKPGELLKGAIQSEVYRAPEVILNSGYTYSTDIWSLGVLLWDLLQIQPLFRPMNPQNPEEYSEAVHLGQITALLGHAPPTLVSQGDRSNMFYQPDGTLRKETHVPLDFSFEKAITCMEGEEKRRFICFVKRMLTWVPGERSTAKELLDDPWLYEDFSS
ncbi:kinase-like domain-containing protein [Emericellopsis atlantica]|uniref:non-specific serine/threonine protein kinase n=1 Tax=Emericellopsis atlantica TaxID=2614577 RepID=A0A9P7ZIX4_9HYPO|nr:kinase-like domain-containing protein [Emericellopsis atlantica]KAG9252953.1 kinase-like domain-containing protein [Emericellopsis atlantica]